MKPIPLKKTFRQRSVATSSSTFQLSELHLTFRMRTATKLKNLPSPPTKKVSICNMSRVIGDSIQKNLLFTDIFKRLELLKGSRKGLKILLGFIARPIMIADDVNDIPDWEAAAKTFA